jgi:hypothetical protein
MTELADTLQETEINETELEENIEKPVKKGRKKANI